MSQKIIEGNPNPSPKRIPDEPYLDISEFFCDTIQGEGINLGHPSAFLRMQHCTMNCKWCDTKEVWRYGNPYSFEELFKLMDEFDLPHKLYNGQHLVLTGGSPLKQLEPLYYFIVAFEELHGFKPYIEIENECTINPPDYFVTKIDCWNNSPKLSNSGNDKELRYQPHLIERLATLKNSWFKFVMMGEYDWQEIEHDFLNTSIIGREQVILMPEGATREQLLKNREKVVEIAIRENVKYCTREHVILWDKATGV